MNAGRYTTRRAQVDQTQEIPIYRDKYGRLFVTKNHQNVEGERVTAFKDSTEMMQAMELRHPDTHRDLYQSDPLFRQSVEGILANTEAAAIGVRVEPRQAIPTDEEMMQGLLDDAARQSYAQLVDRAGGNDAISKLELARMIQNPSQDEREALGHINGMTDQSASRPLETAMKNRRAAGLGPQLDVVPMESPDAINAREAAHNEEILSWLDSQNLDGDSSSDLGV